MTARYADSSRSSLAEVHRRQQEQCLLCPRCQRQSLTTHRNLTWCESCAFEPGDELPAWKPYRMRVKAQ